MSLAPPPQHQFTLMKSFSQPTLINISETDSSTECEFEEAYEHAYEAAATFKSVGFINVVAPIRVQPKVKPWEKAREGMRLAVTRGNSKFDDMLSAKRSISASQKFTHQLAVPYTSWGGKNNRVIAGRCLGSTEIKEESAEQGTKTVIHAASHNYAGFYSTTKTLERIQQKCLDELATDGRRCIALEDALQTRIANFFDSDFSVLTSTGYGANLVALPAILKSGWVVLMDEKCHSSMFMGVYLSNVECIRKFKHNDMLELIALLLEYEPASMNVLVAVEGLYSMDGTVPPLDQLHDLKQRFHFNILMDEAHSMLSIGTTGRGCLEMWNDQHSNAMVPSDLIDIRTCTFSKACGASGGVVVGKARYHAAVLARLEVMQDSGADCMLPSTLVQCLHVFHQTSVLERRLHRMRKMVTFVRKELDGAGIFVYGDAKTPVLALHLGRPSLAAKMSYRLREHGVIAPLIGPPTVSKWESRVRITLSADHDDATVDRLVAAIFAAAQDTGIMRRCKRNLGTFMSVNTATTDQEEAEALLSAGKIEQLIEADATTSQLHRPEVLEAGHAIRLRHGHASGGSRWVCGTFTIHLEAERSISKLLESHETLTYPDYYVGMISTIAALCRPLLGCTSHDIFVPRRAPQAVFDGLKAAPTKTKPAMRQYFTLHHLIERIAMLDDKRAQATLYLEMSQLGDAVESFVLQIHDQIKNPSGLTILLHDDRTEKHDLENGFINARKALAALRGLTENVLVYNSFARAFDLPGAYLSGSSELIEELRYSSRGYMFSSSPLPYVMGMAEQYLRLAG